MHQTITNPNFDALMKYIHRYEGYFTSWHARQAGYSVQNQSYHVQRGNWERHGSGIFRYKHYPRPDKHRPDLIVATLWSCNRLGVPQGVISHDTALPVYKLSTWSGRGIHMTVPRTFRRRSQCIYRVRLHLGELDESDIEDMTSFRVTTPLKTILDLMQSTHVESIHIVDAMKDALHQHLITFYDLRGTTLTPEKREQLLGVLRQANYSRINEI